MRRRRVHEAASAGYGLAADVYAEARPSFPAAAVDWLTGALALEEGDEVVEIGAGTGKFTALLAERGLRVVAVEPVAAMRERLTGLGAAMQVVDAVAEATPFETGSVRTVIAAQSLHWTDAARALAEFDRILGSGGAAGLVWNFRDVSVAWQEELDALLAALRGDAPHSRDGRWQRALATSPFDVAAQREWSWSLPTDAAGVVKRVRSVSYVAALPETEQQRVDEQVRALLARHGLDRDETISFPYVTEAYVLRRKIH